MTDAQLFKQMAQQCEVSAKHFRRRFNGLALANLCNAVWMALVGFVYILKMALPWGLVGFVLLAMSAMALELARQTRRHAQQAFDDFMRIRTRNLETAKILEE